MLALIRGFLVLPEFEVPEVSISLICSWPMHQFTYYLNLEYRFRQIMGNQVGPGDRKVPNWFAYNQVAALA